MHAPYVPIYTDGSKSSEGVVCAAVFPDFVVIISLSVVASIFTAELSAIFLALFFLVFHSKTLIISSFIPTPEVPCSPLGAFMQAIP